MEKKKSKKRKQQKLGNYAFIDSQNLHQGTKHSGWKLSYKRFRTYLRTKYNVQKAYLFIGFVKENTSLYQYLQEAGFILIFKPVLEIKQGDSIQYKGNVDAELVLHTMINYKNFDKAVIVSGDGDFHCLIEYLVKKQKLLKLLAPNSRYSSLLKKFSEYITTLNLIKSKINENKSIRK